MCAQQRINNVCIEMKYTIFGRKKKENQMQTFHSQIVLFALPLDS